MPHGLSSADELSATLALRLDGVRGWTTVRRWPEVSIDGEHVPVHASQTCIPLAAGHHRVAVETKLLWRRSVTEAVVNLARGAETVLVYTPPVSTFGQGTLGPTRDGRRHQHIFLVLAVVVVLFSVIGFLVGQSLR